MPPKIGRTIVCRTEASFAIADECFRNIKSSHFTHFLKLHFTYGCLAQWQTASNRFPLFSWGLRSCPTLLPYPLLCLSLTTTLFSSGIPKFCVWGSSFSHYISIKCRRAHGRLFHRNVFPNATCFIFCAVRWPHSGWRWQWNTKEHTCLRARAAKQQDTLYECPLDSIKAVGTRGNVTGRPWENTLRNILPPH